MSASWIYDFDGDDTSMKRFSGDLVGRGYGRTGVVL